MNVDKFGHHVFKKQKYEVYQNVCSINLADDGCFDAINKTIKHVGNPTDPGDSATKLYVDDAIRSLLSQLKSINQTITQTSTEISTLKKNVDSQLKSINQAITQTSTEISTLKQNVDLLSQKSRKK